RQFDRGVAADLPALHPRGGRRRRCRDRAAAALAERRGVPALTCERDYVGGVHDEPDPGKYRITEVCIGGGETGYTALLPRRRSWLRALRARRRGLHHSEVQPIMTREMLDAVVASSDDELELWWDGDEVVVTDVTDEQPVGNTMV